MSNGSRERILDSVRAALRANQALRADTGAPAAPACSFDEAHFRRQLASAGAEVVDAQSLDEIPGLVAAYCRRHELAARVTAAGKFASLNWQKAGVELATDEQPAVALTGCEGAIAETGQLVISSPQDAWLSLVADCHMAIVELARLRPSLDELAELLGKRPASTATLICGPSRTADIEQTLVMGAHGPKQMCAILLGAAPGGAATN